MSHKAILTTVATTEFVGATSPKVAYQLRRNRLRAAGTVHNADPATLTLDWVDHLGHHVTLTYQENEQTDE